MCATCASTIIREAENDWYGVNDRLSFGPRDLSLKSMCRLSSVVDQVRGGGRKMTAEVTFQVGVVSANASFVEREVGVIGHQVTIVSTRC